ncbi:hypothetical protein RFI_11653, partial [Reticulomyxa filosa]
ECFLSSRIVTISNEWARSPLRSESLSGMFRTVVWCEELRNCHSSTWNTQSLLTTPSLLPISLCSQRSQWYGRFNTNTTHTTQSIITTFQKQMCNVWVDMFELYQFHPGAYCNPWHHDDFVAMFTKTAMYNAFSNIRFHVEPKMLKETLFDRLSFYRLLWRKHVFLQYSKKPTAQNIDNAWIMYVSIPTLCHHRKFEVHFNVVTGVLTFRRNHQNRYSVVLQPGQFLLNVPPSNPATLPSFFEPQHVKSYGRMYSITIAARDNLQLICTLTARNWREQTKILTLLKVYCRRREFESV